MNKSESQNKYEAYLFQMSLQHGDCLKLVCAVCTNLGGQKASRGVSDGNAKVIQEHIFPGYRKGSPSFPQGLCNTCQRKLVKLGKEDTEKNEGDNVKLLLPDDYHCTLPTVTRSNSKNPCLCRWCTLAKLNGGGFKKWQKEMRESRAKKPPVTRVCPSCYKGLTASQVLHTCHSSDQDIVAAMVQNIPPQLKAKLAHSLVKDMQKEQEGKVLKLPPAAGGMAKSLCVGQVATTSKMEPLTHDEAVKMASRAGISGEQQTSIMADVRGKWGRQAVEPGLQEFMPKHNSKYSPFFAVEQKQFLNSEDKSESKHLFHCKDLKGLISKVKQERNIEGATINLIQGDTGQNWTKVCLSIIEERDLAQSQANRVPAAGVHLDEDESDDEGPPNKKVRRRTMAEGVEGGQEFKDWGTCKMFLLAVVRKVPESHHNLAIIFEAIGLDNIPFKLTGDFAFVMPLLGCVKGCGSCNPCPLCDIRRTKEGGVKARWLEGDDVNLRTLGSLYSNYGGWVLDGEKESASGTSKWKSVCATPLISMTEGRRYEDFLMNLLVPGPLHLYLSLNKIINFLEKTHWPEVKEVLKTVTGAQVHVYQGKIGNYEGPNIQKILRHLSLLEPHMPEGSALRLYFEAFQAFKAVSQAVFTSEALQPGWREKLHILRSSILRLNRDYGMSVTPKLHILTTHVEQWIDIFGRPLGREGEQAGESIHHVWKKLLSSMGEPKEKESPEFVKLVMKSLLILNARNT